MFKLLGSAFKRLITAITSPFRLLIVKIGRMLNFNVITAKLISPITKKVKSLITLKPQSWKDYYKIGRRYVYKKLFLTIVLILCAAVFILFTMYMPPIPTVPQDTEQVVTNVEYMYNDMALKDYEGVANIKSADKKTVYTGDVLKGVATGTGSLYDRQSRLVYVGGFLNNSYEGSGIQYYPASGKIKYEGGFSKGLYSGEGKFYDEDGRLVYSGSFLNGLYDGAGQTYDEDGLLTYDGAFMKGRYHGSGTCYYKNGVAKYIGEFFEGAAQGAGSLYSEQGKLLYTGAMYGGTINYRSLLHATFEDIETAFSETPVIYHTSTDCVFVYEQAGCAFTVNCAVRLYEQENNNPPKSESGENYFFFPDGTVTTGSGTVVSPPSAQSGPVIGDGTEDASSSSSESQSSSSESGVVIGTSAGGLLPLAGDAKTAQLGAKLPPLFIENCAWEVTDSGTTGSGSSSGTVPPSSSSQAPAAPSASSSAPVSQGSASSGMTVSGSESSSVDIFSEQPRPSFIETTYTLYFEVDTGVWVAEGDLDKSKIQVDSVTVFNGDEPVALEGALEYDNTDPPALGDCVAIGFIRNRLPTAFSNIVYETNSQMRLIVEVTGINYAGLIVRKSYTVDNMTYLYCYQFGDDTKELMYYVIEG